mgnify:CR=1 FL=1
MPCTDSPTPAAYSTNGLLLLRPSHCSAKRSLSAFELPREDAERDAFVVQFLQADVTAEIFNVNAVMWKQGIVS